MDSQRVSILHFFTSYHLYLCLYLAAYKYCSTCKLKFLFKKFCFCFNFDFQFSRKFAHNIEQEYLNKTCFLNFQYFLAFLMILEVFIRFAAETTIINKNQFYGFLILNCVTSSCSWIISILIVYIESFKGLPSVPSRGHGLILLVIYFCLK